MKRLTPYLIFVLLTGGLVAFIYKDRIFPADPGSTNAAAQQPGAGGRGTGGGRGGGGRRANQIVPVLAEKARTANVPVYLNGVGTVQAFNTATVRTQVSGRLTDVPYTEGQDVKVGDVLATIDAVLYQAAYDQAVAQKAKDEAILANSRLDEKRYTNLVKTEAATKQQADTAVWAVKQNEAQVNIDQALIDNAKANLDYATVKAPIAGRTGIRLVDKGNLVSATDATGIVIITQLRPIAIVFTLPENTVPDILEAQEKGVVPLQAVTGAGLLGEGTLLVIDNQVDQTTGTVKIKGVFPNDKSRLWPGQFVNVKLKLKTLENAIVVSSLAVQQGANGSYVYLVTPENTVKLTYVKIVQEGEKQSVIGEGVAAGDMVVTSGFANLQDGTKVQVDTAPANGAAQAGPNTGPDAASQTTPAPPPADGQPPRRRRSDAADANGASSNGNRGAHRKTAEQPSGHESALSSQDAPRQ
jgi:membrane fusion protein, multidrug efflux system